MVKLSISITQTGGRDLRPLILAVTLVALATLVVAGLALTRAAPPPITPVAAPLPDPARLRLVGSSSLSVTALYASENTLWIGGTESGQHALYSLDLTQSNAAPVSRLELPSQILKLTVDCHNNVWALVQNFGTLAFNTTTGKYSTLLSIESTNGWLRKTTSYAVATRCNGDSVDVWLGREGVQHLSYSGAYPTQINYSPPDPAFTVAHDVRALLYSPSDDVLWVAADGRLTAVPLNGVLGPRTYPFEDESIWSLALESDGQIWASGTSTLFRIPTPGSAEYEALPIASSNDSRLTSGIWNVAARPGQVWISDPSCTDATTCWSVGTLIQQKFHDFSIEPNRAIHIRV